MQIDKQQIIQLLMQQGQQDQAQQAEQELPGQVDTDNAEHQNLLQRFGIHPMDLISKFTGGLGGGLNL